MFYTRNYEKVYSVGRKGRRGYDSYYSYRLLQCVGSPITLPDQYRRAVFLGMSVFYKDGALKAARASPYNEQYYLLENWKTLGSATGQI